MALDNSRTERFNTAAVLGYFELRLAMEMENFILFRGIFMANDPVAKRRSGILVGS